MATGFRRSLRIKNSFLLVLVLIQVLIIVVAVLFTRIALKIIDDAEAEKLGSVISFVVNTIEQASSSALTGVLAVAANDQYMGLFQARDRDALLGATEDLFSSLKAHGVKQFQFNLPEFKTFLRVHNPLVFGEDFTTERPTLVSCITEKKVVYGLEQGRSGYGFRAVTPAYHRGQFIGCVEMGSDLDERFLEDLNANYRGKWAIVRIEKSLNLTQDMPVVATLNEPQGGTIFSNDFTTAEPILVSIGNSQPYSLYDPKTEEMSLYVPIKNFKGNVALYVRYVSKTAYYGAVRTMVVNALGILLVSMVLSGLVFIFLYREIKNPVQKLVTEMEKMKNFDFGEKKEVINTSLVELAILVKGFEDMRMGLQSFQKYVPANLVRQLVETHQVARIGGKSKELTVFFSDISGFTKIAENLSPNQLTTQLSQYLDQVTNTILEGKGTVDKYIGDAVMAFWGAPYEMEDHALQACRAALRCQQRIRELSGRWKAEGKYEFNTRIGLSTGDIVVGNIGSEKRLNYTVIGDPVNLARRLETLNKEYKTSIIISQHTYEKCSKYVEVRPLDFVIVMGRAEPVAIYELVGESGDLSIKQKEFIGLFKSAVNFYLVRDWDRAIHILDLLAEKDPQDYPVKLYLERCRRFKMTAPDEHWQGEYRLK
jgi:class 3 adenylate cyclase